MTEGHETNWWGVVTHQYDENGVEYVRKNLSYTRAGMEAAIKRALDVAANEIDCGGCYNNCFDPTNCHEIEAAHIRALDPSQFIEKE